MNHWLKGDGRPSPRPNPNKEVARGDANVPGHHSVMQLQLGVFEFDKRRVLCTHNASTKIVFGRFYLKI